MSNKPSKHNKLGLAMPEVPLRSLPLSIKAFVTQQILDNILAKGRRRIYNQIVKKTSEIYDEERYVTSGSGPETSLRPACQNTAWQERVCKSSITSVDALCSFAVISLHHTVLRKR